MKTIYLLRHGETQANRDDIFRGHSDIALSPRGVKQAEELRGHFKEIAIKRIFSSPLKRAWQTAEMVFPGRKIEKDELLNNLDLGSWSGRSKKEIARIDPRRWQRWITRPETMVFPQGEAVQDVFGRTRRFLKKIVALPEEKIAVVSHRAVLKVMLAAALNVSRPYFWKFHLDNASISILFHDPSRGFILYRSNETDHLSNFVFEWH